MLAGGDGWNKAAGGSDLGRKARVRWRAMAAKTLEGPREGCAMERWRDMADGRREAAAEDSTEVVFADENQCIEKYHIIIYRHMALRMVRNCLRAAGVR